MAVTVTEVTTGINDSTWEVEASADADTTATITHGFNTLGLLVWVIPLLAAFYTSQWRITSFTLTTVVATKGTAMGSGAAGAQIRVVVLPYDFKRLVPGAA